MSRIFGKEKSGKKKRANADSIDAIKANPQEAEVYNNRGNTKIASGEKEGALADYTKAIELDPNNINAYKNRGLVKSKLGDTKGAIADFTKVLDLISEYGIKHSTKFIQ